MFTCPLKTELSHTLAPSAHAVFLTASMKTTQLQLAATPEMSNINVFFSTVLVPPPPYSYMNRPLCALFTCIHLRNKKDETGDNINPSSLFIIVDAKRLQIFQASE